MFGLPKRQLAGETAVIKIDGMHCSSCTLAIDGALEDLGVLRSATNYAKGETKVEYDGAKLSLPQIVAEIEKQGYKVIRP
jgi:copper chaperone CopZ